MKLNKWQSRILRAAGSAILIAAIFWFIPFSDVIASLRDVHPGLAAAGLLMFLVSAYLEAIALWLPLKRAGLPNSHWSVFEIKMITRFYGQFLPSELMGSALKLHRLAGPSKQWGEVIAGLAYTRLINMLVLSVLGLVFWTIEMPDGPGRWVGPILFGMAAVLLAIHLSVVSPKMNWLARKILSTRAFRLFHGKLAERFLSLARKMVDSYRLFGNTLPAVTALAIVRHILGIISFGVIALSLGIHIDFLTIGWIRVVLYALLMLPISVSGIGVREGSLVLLLQEYDVEAGEAVALAFLLFAVQIINNALGALFEIRNMLSPRRSTHSIDPVDPVAK